MTSQYLLQQLILLNNFCDVISLCNYRVPNYLDISPLRSLESGQDMDYYSDENVHWNVLGYGESRYQSENSVRLYKIPETWSFR